MTFSPASVTLFNDLLQSRTGQSLSESRYYRLDSVLLPLARECGLTQIDALAAAVVEGRDPALADRIVEALLNNESYFFRDRAPFQSLRDSTLPLLAQKCATSKRIRIWCAGASTGQEPYSLAMMFAEDAEKWAGWSIDILATDISRSAVERARTAIYSQFEVQRGLHILELARHFSKVGGDWHVNSGVQRRVRFLQHNLLDPAPPGPFDLILCRNVLFYFSETTRRQVFDNLCHAIALHGLLMLGAGETVLGSTEHFMPDRRQRGFYMPVAAMQPTSSSVRRRA